MAWEMVVGWENRDKDDNCTFMHGGNRRINDEDVWWLRSYNLFLVIFNSSVKD